MGLRVISAYICEKGIKHHVHQIIGACRDYLGKIEGTKIVHVVQRVYRGTWKAIKVCSTMHGKISCNNPFTISQN